MVSLLDFAKSFVSAHLSKNGIAVDFTMGNGYDTEYLCSLVPDGTVYAFDIQKQALENTAARLSKRGFTNAVLIHDSHANASRHIGIRIDAGMFNLGYLPGGDKLIHTMTDSTRAAVLFAVDALSPGGVLVISVYPGHEEGRREGEMIKELLRSLDKTYYCAVHFHILNSADAPYIIAVEKYAK